MTEKRTVWQRLLHIEPGVALGQWAFDRLSNNWPLLVSLFAGGGGISWLASAEAFMAPYGNLGIVVVGVAAALLIGFGIAGINALAAWSAERRTHAEYNSKAISSYTINPLDKYFEKKHISLSNFYSPMFRLRENVSFSGCEIIGPCNVILNGNTNMMGSILNDCDFVVVKNNVSIHGAVGFLNANFSDCILYRITIYCPADMAHNLAAQFGSAMNIISDGNSTL